MSRRAATVALMETQRPPNWLYLDDSDHKEIGIRRATTTDWVMRCSCARCPSWVRLGQPTWYKENPVLRAHRLKYGRVDRTKYSSLYRTYAASTDRVITRGLQVGIRSETRRLQSPGHKSERQSATPVAQ